MSPLADQWMLNDRPANLRQDGELIAGISLQRDLGRWPARTMMQRIISSVEEAVSRPISRLCLMVVLLLGAARCSSTGWRDALDSRVAASSVAPSTSASPSEPWNAAVTQPKIETSDAILPAGVVPGGTVTLPQIIDSALTNNPTTRTAWLRAREAEAGFGSSRAAYLPEITVGVSATRSQSASTGTTSSPAQTRIAPTVSLSYLLFDFGGREAAVEQARQTLIAADYLHNQAIQDVILRAQQTYYDYLDSRSLLDAQEATLKERQAGLNIAEGRHEAGVATIADVLQARTALSQATLRYETIEGNLRALEGSLANVMGLPPNSRFTIAGALPEEPPQQVLKEVDALIEEAAAARPRLAAQRAFAMRAAARIRAVRAEGLPRVSIDNSAGLNVTPGSGGRTSQPYTAGVSLRFPLFTGGRNVYDVRAAEANAQAAAEEYRDVRQRVYLDVWTSYYALQTAAQRAATSRELLSYARQSVDVASGRYRSGVGTILDLLTAEAALENARAQEVQARTDWFVAMAQLAHDTGTLDASDRNPR